MANVRLQALAVKFWGEGDLVLQRFSHIFPNGHQICSALHTWTQEMCVIRLQDAWARFCRELILVSASEQPLTAGGTTVPRALGISRRGDALVALRRVYTRFPHEPRWFDAQACLNGATILSIRNYAAVSAGIGVTPSPLDDLRDLRNFLSHRNETTAANVRAASVRNSLVANLDVIAILKSTNLGPPPVTILELWIKQLQTMAQIAVR